MSILFSQNLPKNNEIRPQESKFTEVLESIAVKPKMLYFYGKMPEKRSKSVAIVGTRKPTKYGETVAYKLAYELVKRGVVVISGLAYGIDAIAARGALDAGGVTVAVLGTPIDQIYPRANEELARRIIKNGGCVMSELAVGEKFLPKVTFLKRNRIISGLADVVIIPEAAERSGSLNTAAHALEQGREVFAVPGNINQPMSQGCNKLIRQGAIPCTGINDVLEVLLPTVKSEKQNVVKIRGDDETETAILQKLNDGVDEGEEIVTRLEMMPGDFNRTMTLLEIKGRVRSLGANRWTLA